MHARAPVVLGCLLGVLGAQDPAALVERLRAAGERGRVAVELRRLGSAAATALVEALRQPGCREADVLAQVLAELGPAAGGELGRLVALLPSQPEPRRTSLLRALANGVLACPDEAAVDRLRAELGAWARAGFFYSGSATEPSFAWYEYVRLQRRLSLRQRGTRPADLLRALDTIREGRQGLGGVLGGGWGGQPAKLHDLGAFGQHATREEIEAIAELALAHGASAAEVFAELANYLAPEAPRPAETLRESCAGIGENAPAALPAVQFPTLWRRDDWRFAVARAVFAFGPQAEERTHALRHLLHAPIVADRLAALAAVRERPQPWRAFASDLAACVAADDRLVVRDALVTLGQAQGIELPKVELGRLVAGADKELAMLAKRLLAR